MQAHCKIINVLLYRPNLGQLRIPLLDSEISNEVTELLSGLITAQLLPLPKPASSDVNSKNIP